jgi:hypothetical protein
VYRNNGPGEAGIFFRGNGIGEPGKNNYLFLGALPELRHQALQLFHIMQQRGDNSYFLGETDQAARKTGVRLAELAASSQKK